MNKTRLENPTPDEVEELVGELQNRKKFANKAFYKSTPLLQFDSYRDAAAALLEHLLVAASLYDKRHLAVALWAAGRCWDEQTEPNRVLIKRLFDEMTMTTETEPKVEERKAASRFGIADLYLKAIETDPDFGMTYYSLAAWMPPWCKSVTLPLAAAPKAQFNSKKKSSCSAAAALSSEVESVRARVVGKEELYLIAIDLSPTLLAAYNNLGNVLPKDRSVQLLNGQRMTARDLFAKVIELEPTYGHSYCNLATKLDRNEVFQLADGTRLTQRDCFMKALVLDPTDAVAINNLGTLISPNESVTLPDGTSLTSRGLYLQAIAVNPDLTFAYENLALMLDPGEEITLLDGKTKVSDRDLLKTAIQRAPHKPNGYSILAQCIGKENSNEIVELHDGSLVTRRDLIMLALQHSTHREEPWCLWLLRSSLCPFQDVLLPCGRRYGWKGFVA